MENHIMGILICQRCDCGFRDLNRPSKRNSIDNKVLLSGYVPDYLYDLGKIDRSKPFVEPLIGANRKAIHTAVVAGLRVKIDF
jgi:hypothetical protein